MQIFATNLFIRNRNLLASVVRKSNRFFCCNNRLEKGLRRGGKVNPKRHSEFLVRIKTFYNTSKLKSIFYMLLRQMRHNFRHHYLLP